MLREQHTITQTNAVNQTDVVDDTDDIEIDTIDFCVRVGGCDSNRCRGPYGPASIPAGFKHARLTLGVSAHCSSTGN